MLLPHCQAGIRNKYRASLIALSLTKGKKPARFRIAARAEPTCAFRRRRVLDSTKHK